MLGGEFLAQQYLLLTWLKYMQAVIITRLHVMYQRSRKMLFFLVVIFLAVMIACGVLIGEMSSDVIGGKL